MTPERKQGVQHDAPGLGPAVGTLQAVSLRWWGHLAALGGYVLVSLLVLAPLLPHFSRMIPGGPVAAVDGWQNVWNLWWVHRALTNGMNPFHSPYLYYPAGVDLHLQTLNISNGVLVFPVTALFGPIAGYNAAVFLAFVLAGMGGYALALHVAGHRLAAFAGGLVFAFSPFHLTKVWDGQLELIALQWPAFYALFLLRAAEWLRWRDTLVAGVFLALIGYTSWYYLLFFAVYSALFVVLWLATTGGWARRGRLLVRMGGVALVGVLLLAPILLPALANVRGETTRINPNSSLDLILIHSANLFDFWLPSYVHPLWGAAVERLGSGWHPFIAGWNLALGYGTLALAVLGGAVAWRRAWRWWVLALTALILSLGPLLHVGTTRTAISLPYALLLDLPGVSIARRPSHFVVISVLLFAPLVALGLRWLLERVPAPRRALLLVAVLALLAVELAPPRWPLLPLTAHPYYATLTGEPGALLDLPPRNESSGPLQAQMVHAMPILGGFVSRAPAYPFVSVTPGVRELWAMRPDDTRLLALEPQDKLAALNVYGIRQVVVHWDLVEPERRGQLEQALREVLPGVAPAYADATFSAYRVPEVRGRPFMHFGSGWHPEEHQDERRWRWMQETGEFALVNPTDQPVPVAIDLRAQSYQEPRAVTLAFDGQVLGRWQVGLAETGTTLRFLLPPGTHPLRLQAPASAETGGARQLSIVVVGVEMR